jgi:hypothetical protein
MTLELWVLGTSQCSHQTKHRLRKHHQGLITACWFLAVVDQRLDHESTVDLLWLVGTYPSRRLTIQLCHQRFNVSNLPRPVHVNAFGFALKTWLANPSAT